ncbi:hypothetical protein FACS189483_10430 [Spirochaetia bacterium]|nr:hypothetical protein FACS189483_10430 [Spirochaetia bacterium]
MNKVKDTAVAEIGIDGEYDGDICPECGKVHIPNAVTLAAMQEIEDQIAGKLPEKRHNSIEGFFADLYT